MKTDKLKYAFAFILLLCAFLCGVNFKRWYTANHRIERIISLMYSSSPYYDCYGNFEELLRQEFRKQGIEPVNSVYASQNMGANDLNRVNKGVNTALGIGCVYSVASFLILRVLDKALIGLFLESSQTEIMANAQSFIFWNSVFYIPLAVLIIYRYTIQGLGYSSLAMFAGVAEMIARALVGFLFVPLWGYFAACIANPVAWFFACFFLIPAYIVVFRKLKQEKARPHANL